MLMSVLLHLRHRHVVHIQKNDGHCQLTNSLTLTFQALLWGAGLQLVHGNHCRHKLLVQQDAITIRIVKLKQALQDACGTM